MSEAAAKELPMAFINAVAGCESHNLEFFVEKGAAVTAPTAEELAEKSIRVLFSCNDRKTMKTAMEECHFPDAAGFIYETLIGEVKNEQKQYC